MHPDKSSLSIRLTEPVVPLRYSPEYASLHRESEMLPPGIVRGLLTLELTKPTKISSIELELQARASTSYTQGAGPSRVDVTEQYKIHSASSVVFKASSVPQFRNRDTPTGPRIQFLDDHAAPRPNALGGDCGRVPSDARSCTDRSVSLGPLSLEARRRLSCDEWVIDGPRQDGLSIDPAPPYSSPDGQQAFLSPDAHPSWVGRSSSVASSSRITADSHGSPFPFRRNLTPEFPYRSSPSSMRHSIRDLPLSRTSSIEELAEDDGESFESPDSAGYYGLSRMATGSSGRSSEQGMNRGRSRSRFSLGKVVHIFDAVKERVRSQSPRAQSRARSDVQEERGRSLVKGKGKAEVSIHGVRNVPPKIGVAEHSAAEGVHDQSGDGWSMFAEGTYTYPILFTIPHNSPPTMRTPYGSLIWKVKAELKRPGVFASRLTAQKEVIVVAQPNDNVDEIEGIDLERQWDGQFQYRVHVGGRAFPIGGKMPFQLTIMPLAKMKLHCVFVYLDERTVYYTRAETQARSDAIRRATLLVIKNNNTDEKHNEPILPLKLDEPDAFRKSPLYRFLRPGEDESEVASSFMGPGPWTIRHQLNIPDSCLVLHPSNQTKGSNAKVDHILKIVLRVEKEETVAGGRKKLYDIVIHTPIQILSCHCTSEWTSLPRYDEALLSEAGSLEDTSMCPCRTRQRTRPQTSAAEVLAAPRGRVMSSPMSSSCLPGTFSADSLAGRTRLHERLMSGFVSERGEAPPSYESYDVLA